MELLLLNENQKIDYFGKCKIVVNLIKKSLIVNPTEQEDLKVCPIHFSQDIFKQNYILYLFASENFPFDLILIFPSIESCNKIFEAIQKSKDSMNNDSTESNLQKFQQSLFKPLLKECQINITFASRVKKFITDFLIWVSCEQKKKYLAMIKEDSEKLFYDFLTIINGEGNLEIVRFLATDETINEDLIEMDRIKRKTSLDKNEEDGKKSAIRVNLMDYSDESDETSDSDESYLLEENEAENSDNDSDNSPPPKKAKPDISLSDIVKAPDFKLLSYDEYGILRKKLFIFPVEDKTLCYIYGWGESHKRYICWRCAKCQNKRHFISAIVYKNEKEEDYVKLFKTRHLCSLIKYDPEKYSFDSTKQIVFKPNFQMFKFEEFGIQKCKLVIFSTSDETLCYEYFCMAKKGSRENYYQCKRCQKSRHVRAKVCKNNDNEEIYLKLNKGEHICKMIKFDPDNYIFDESKRIVKAPNFQVTSYQQKDGIKKKLFIFTSLEEKVGYDYYYTKNKFFCCGCSILRAPLPTAKILQNEDGGDYLQLNKTKHVCEKRKFADPENKVREYFARQPANSIKIYKPDYEIVEQMVYFVKRTLLLIIVPENRDLCYQLFYCARTNNYICYRCTNNSNPIRAYICFDADGKEYISVYDRPHICQPLPYSVKRCKMLKTIHSPDYIFQKQKYHGKLVDKLVIFTNEEKTLCYDYIKNSKKPNSWRCWSCQSQFKIGVYAKFIKNADQEYIELGQIEHQCESKKFIPEETITIVRKPNFIVESGRTNFRNKETKRLSVFDPLDRSLCYSYLRITKNNCFRCSKCSNKTKSSNERAYVSATLIQPENEEEYVILNGTKHICKMEKYTPLNPTFKIVNLPNFYFKKSHRGDVDFLVIKDENSKNLWYTYGYNREKDAYLCNKCGQMGKHASAKLNKVENGEDYIELGPIQHICKPEPKK